MSKTTTYNAIGLVISNIRNVADLHIEFPDDTKPIYIYGGNGSGKSTVLHAPQALFGGKAFLGDDPVKHGEKSGMVKMTLRGDDGTEFTAKMTVRPDGSVTVTIRKADGTNIKNPVKTLKGLAGQIGLNPVAFAEMTPAARRQHILDASDFDEPAHKAAVKALEDQRVQHGRDKKDAEGALSLVTGLSVPVDIPDVEVPMADLVAKMQVASEQKAGNDKTRLEFKTDELRLGQEQDKLSTLKGQMSELRRSLESQESVVGHMKGNLEDKLDIILTLTDPDTTTIQQRMNDNETMNKHVREKQQRTKSRKDIAEAQAGWDAKDDEIKALKQAKVAAFKAIDLPEGFAITDDDITVDGTLVSGLSHGEKVKAGVRLALNDGRLNLVIIEDGTALDADNLEECLAMISGAGKTALVEVIEPPKEAEVRFEMYGGAVLKETDNG